MTIFGCHLCRNSFNNQTSKIISLEAVIMSDNGFQNNSKGVSEKSITEEAEFHDTNITCIDCNADFIWTSGEQVFFRDKNLKNPPKRCRECKNAKNERIAAIAASQTSGIRQKIEVSVNCATCASPTTVPFYPSQGRPVYCRSCFISMNPSIVSDSFRSGS